MAPHPTPQHPRQVPPSLNGKAPQTACSTAQLILEQAQHPQLPACTAPRDGGVSGRPDYSSQHTPCQGTGGGGVRLQLSACTASRGPMCSDYNSQNSLGPAGFPRASGCVSGDRIVTSSPQGRPGMRVAIGRRPPRFWASWRAGSGKERAARGPLTPSGRRSSVPAERARGRPGAAQAARTEGFNARFDDVTAAAEPEVPPGAGRGPPPRRGLPMRARRPHGSLASPARPARGLCPRRLQLARPSAFSRARRLPAAHWLPLLSGSGGLLRDWLGLA